jgi:spore maturation protein SpmA
VNWIFLGLLATSVLTAAWTGSMAQVTDASLSSARAAVELALSLVGQMTLWLGFVGVMREAGLLASFARALRPLMTWLFPEVPADHPAMGAMIMNIAANMLGMGNAATPFGLKAMQELDSLNPKKGVATNAMALFLAINTTGIAVLPLTTVGVRAALGSRDAAGIIAPTLVATLSSTLVAVLVARLLQGSRSFAFGRYEAQAIDPAKSQRPDAAALERAQAMAALRPQAPGWQRIVALLIFVGLLLALARFVAGQPAETPAFDVVRAVLSGWLFPLLLVGIATVAFARGVKVYEAFVTAAKEGFQTAITIIPFLVGMLVAIGMFRASGAMNVLVAVLSPLVAPFGFPPEALPMALIRPLSGSGATAVMSDVMKLHGPDSFIGYLVSVINGGTETTFYVLALYFGAVQVRVLRHTLPACLAADFVGPTAAFLVCRVFFG